MKNKNSESSLLDSILNSTHGKKVKSENFVGKEKDFYWFILNIPKDTRTYYSDVTAENYVSAIRELKILLEYLNLKDYEIDNRIFFEELESLKNNDFRFPFDYMVGNIATRNFEELNKCWNGTYSASIDSLHRYITFMEEIELEEKSNSLNEKKHDKEDGNFSVILINSYERNPKFRKKCLADKGYNCYICGYNFMEKFGELGKEFIHVHHEIPLSLMKQRGLKLDSNNLYPLCPNCHSMIHKTDPLMSVCNFKMKYSNKI